MRVLASSGPQLIEFHIGASLESGIWRARIWLRAGGTVRSIEPSQEDEIRGDTCRGTLAGAVDWVRRWLLRSYPSFTILTVIDEPSEALPPPGRQIPGAAQGR